MAKVIILGSTGLTGGLLLDKVLGDAYFNEVTVLVRKPLERVHPKLKVIVTDFKKFTLPEADIVFSCLGTTLKKTPDPDTYRFIEVGIPVAVAQQLKEKGLQQFHYISSIGASVSSAGAYLKNKWEAETKLSGLDLPSLYIYRPSLIHGDRKESRLLEGISNAILSVIGILLIGGLKKYKRIHADVIANAMVINAKRPVAGKHVLESDVIQKIG